ncbi:MAG: hypothetical protein IKE43_06805 [Coriobacteriales bacterium]|nr:hypothetical protein [Coriobacteriales bacterium]
MNALDFIIALLATLLLSTLLFGAYTYVTTATTSSPAVMEQPYAGDTPQETSGAVDISTWNTLGDALSAASKVIGVSQLEDSDVIVLKVNESIIRVIAKIDPALSDEFYELSFFDDDFTKKATEIVGDSELVSAEDLTLSALTQDELKKYIGKTGQDLLDAGFVFERYIMYGSEQTMASYDYGFFSYDFMFDVSVPESATDDDGASLKDAKISDFSFWQNLSNEALEVVPVN